MTVRARVIFYLVFILLTLAGCPGTNRPEACPSQQDSQGVWQCAPSPVVSCYRWNNDGITETECQPQQGRQPAPSASTGR